MTVKEVINFYFKKYREMMVKVEMLNGIEGKYHKITKDGFYKLFGNWDNEVAIKVHFETHNTHWYNGKTEYIERDLPVLYICYM